jgi:hypothetical protein
MESMVEIVRDHSRRVKRWESGEMALRWSAAGMLAAQDPVPSCSGLSRAADPSRGAQARVAHRGGCHRDRLTRIISYRWKALTRLNSTTSGTSSS